jgi:hypothetical protein
MATTRQELEGFRQFVERRLGAGDTAPSLDELFDQWRHENPSDALSAESVSAIAASIEDFKRGDRGTLAGNHSAELRREFGISSDK